MRKSLSMHCFYHLFHTGGQVWDVGRVEMGQGNSASFLDVN